MKMDLKERKEKINEEFTKIEQQLSQLLHRKAELIGQYKLVQDLEKESEKESSSPKQE